jgi:hypothetical protein
MIPRQNEPVMFYRVWCRFAAACVFGSFVIKEDGL